jgi:hypothetical protein
MPRLLDTYVQARESSEMEMLSRNGDCGKNCGTPTFVKPGTSSHMSLDTPTSNALNLTTVEGIARGTTFSTKIRAYLILTCQEHERTHNILVVVDRKRQAVHRIFTHSLKIHTRRFRHKDVQTATWAILRLLSRRRQSWRITTTCIVSSQPQVEQYHLATVSRSDFGV